MKALLLMLDGVVCGGAACLPDGESPRILSLASIFQSHPTLAFPDLFQLGLWKIVTGDVFDPRSQGTQALWGRIRSLGSGADPLAILWEIAGAIDAREPPSLDPIPEPFVAELEKAAGTEFIRISGGSVGAILDECAREHLRAGKPILSIAPGSVIEIAAHSSTLLQMELYRMCRAIRRCADRWRIRKVIAQPFMGSAGAFVLLPGRREFCLCPPRTVLNAIADRGLAVHGIGSIRESFAGSGITRSTPSETNPEALDAIDAAWSDADDGLVFAELPAFAQIVQSSDADEYARELLRLDGWIGRHWRKMETDDLVIVTGRCPAPVATQAGPVRREEAPLIAIRGEEKGPLGTRSSYVDVAASLAHFFRLGAWPAGQSFLR